MSSVNNKAYYVYQAKGLNDVLLYIGKGKGDRLKHCNSGISHCYGLNEYHFKHGKNSMSVNILSYFYTEDDALKYEESCIKKLKPLFNVMNNSDKIVKTDIESLVSDTVVDYKRMMLLYIKSLESDDKDTIAIIEDKSPVQQEVNLFYVACTRAIKNLAIPLDFNAE